MKVLGLDVSTKSTGWFITKSSCGKICPPDTLSFEEKLAHFRQSLLDLLQKYSPDVVVVEDAYFQPRKGSIYTLKALSRFGGVAMEACASQGIKVVIMTATTARKFCCGRREGKVTKEHVFDFFTAKYQLTDWKFTTHNDLTDAMALAWGYREKIKSEKKSNSKKAR